jgi:hypothetical protein
MSNSIYDEAIAEAALIRESAEDRAKAKIIEAMTPQIKSLVEKSLFNEDSHSEKENDEESDNEKRDEEEASDKDENREDGDAKTYKESATKNHLDLDNFNINEASVFMKGLITNNTKKALLKSELQELSERSDSLNTALLMIESKGAHPSTIVRFDDILTKLTNEIKTFENNIILNSNKPLLETYINIKKELNNMSRRRSRIEESLEELFETHLFEAEEEEEKDSEEEEEQVQTSSFDKDAAEEALEDLMASLGLDDVDVSLGGGESSDSSSEEEEEDDDMDFDLDDISLEDEDEDEEEDEEEDDDKNEGDAYEMDAGPIEGEMIEIDENMLRREIGKMRRLREGEAKAMASHFGGGKLGKEMFVDVDDSILNALANEIGDAPVPKPASGKSLVESKNERRKNRMLESKVNEYKSALNGMKKQLSEMNLFNAKLLYANKLMQNKQLTPSQQRHIVESLDNAKTLDEAKRTFEKLQKSESKANINENASRRVLSSSSRSVQSAQSANGSADLDRWARLAGLK